MDWEGGWGCELHVSVLFFAFVEVGAGNLSLKLVFGVSGCFMGLEGFVMISLLGSGVYVVQGEKSKDK